MRKIYEPEVKRIAVMKFLNAIPARFVARELEVSNGILVENWARKFLSVINISPIEFWILNLVLDKDSMVRLEHVFKEIPKYPELINLPRILMDAGEYQKCKALLAHLRVRNNQIEIWGGKEFE